ncbi:MAG: hypothetical protein ACYTAF_08205 [Planctomycetota bacterium]|jgi:hypothetical protein
MFGKREEQTPSEIAHKLAQRRVFTILVVVTFIALLITSTVALPVLKKQVEEVDASVKSVVKLLVGLGGVFTVSMALFGAAGALLIVCAWLGVIDRLLRPFNIALGVFVIVSGAIMVFSFVLPSF